MGTGGGSGPQGRSGYSLLLTPALGLWSHPVTYKLLCPKKPMRGRRGWFLMELVEGTWAPSSHLCIRCVVWPLGGTMWVASI